MRELLMREAPAWMEGALILIFFIIALEIRAFYPVGFASDFFGFSLSAFSGIALLDVFRLKGEHVKFGRFTAEVLKSVLVKLALSVVVGFVVAVGFLLLNR